MPPLSLSKLKVTLVTFTSLRETFMPPINFIIRDALETDIAPCLALDASYQTENVWQMSLQPLDNGWQVLFRTERLPRAIEVSYDIHQERLPYALAQHSFLVATTKDDGQLLGYTTLRYDALNQVAIVRDIVVANEMRRMGVGTRLLSVAKRWAQEQNAAFFLTETQTKNYPAIQFCQRQGLSFCGFNDKTFSNHEIAVYFGQVLR